MSQQKDIYNPEKILGECQKLFVEKNREKGNGYHVCGELLKTLFPKGVRLHSKEDINVYNNLLHILDCLTRITTLLGRDELYHYQANIDQTAVDMTVYSSMLVALLRCKEVHDRNGMPKYDK